MTGDDKIKLLQRVQAVQAAMQATVSAADAFTAGLAGARTALAQAAQSAATAPSPQDVQALLDRLAALETALDNLPAGSTVDVARMRSQIASLRQEVNALLVAAQNGADLKAKVTSAQSRLAALDARAAEVAKTKASAGQVLGQANALQAELQSTPAVAAVERGIQSASAEAPEPAVNDASQAVAAIVPETGARRPLTAIRRIVIHHTGMAPAATAEEVVRRAAGRGRQGIPYHYLVAGSGTIYQLAGVDRSVNQSRTAAVDADAVGVALGGDFDLAVPGEAQVASAADLIARLLTRLGLHVSDIYGRSELEGGTTSPGMQWSQGVRWRDDLVAAVAELIPAVPRFDS